MAYCASADIASEFKDIVFSASTAVTDDEVDEFCDQASALIDGEIASKYSVPVTAPGALLILKMIAIWLVKARILSILSVKTPQDKTKQDPDGPTLYKQAMDLLKQIKSGALVLSNAETSSSDGGMTSFLKDQDITYDYRIGEDVW